MRIVFLALALLIFGWAAQAEASPNKGYYYGAKNPGQIADLVEKSLARDPSGKTMLDAAKCRRDGSCAAPINYVESFQSHDPQAQVTLQNLVAYLRSLVIDCTVKGKFQMDLIVWTGGSLGRTKVNGLARKFLKNECAWVNPETRRPVLAQNCANPVGQQLEIVCVYINFETRDSAERAVAWERIKRATDPCFAFRKVSKLYEADSPTATWHNIKPGCIGKPCTFDNYNRTFGYRQKSQGMIPLGGPGFYQIRLSPEEILALCLKSWDHGPVRSSFTAGARWQQDYRKVGREWHTRVYYGSSELAADNLTISGPKGLLFWASSVEDERKIIGSYR